MLVIARGCSLVPVPNFAVLCMVHLYRPFTERRVAGYGVCMSLSICMVMAVSNSYCRLAISGQVLPASVLCLHPNQQEASLQPVGCAGKLICSSDCCLLGLWTVAGSMDCS